jgi:uncharacterized protein YndB with AHSA1/START domain
MNPDLDLAIARVIKAPRAAVWAAWTDPAKLAQWWLPAPYRCRVVAFEPRAGGAFRTEMSEDGQTFTPHVDGCFLAMEPMDRLVFTNAMTAGWRPAAGRPYPTPMTAVVTFRDHPDGTDYAAQVLHADNADRATHADMGFHEGWGTVTAQLAALVERG